jgi:hypothetical protein
MKRLQIIILTFGICGLISCNGQQDNGATFNQSFQVGSIPGISDFETLNEEEKHTDSLKTRHKKDWRNNRSRVFMNFYTNGKLSEIDSAFIKGFPTPCECLIDKDTMFVSMGIGFFGGLGTNLKVFRDRFIGSFYEYTDDVKPYKTNLNDTAFSNYVLVPNKYQHLTLSDMPTWQSDQQLSGLMNFTSNDFYEETYGHVVDSKYVTGKIYFTCKTRQKTK